ncbi:MAG: hypothetical protein ACC628_08365 [Pirellulaceae bacterium]
MCSLRFRFALLWLVAVPCLAGQPRIRVELATESGFPIDGQRRWIETLKDLNLAGLRIRKARFREQVGVTNQGTEAAPVYSVVGLLTDRNRLILPGAEFSINDRSGIARWFEKLRTDGLSGPTEQPLAFGLSGDELVSFHEQVAKPLMFDTQGRRAGDVVRQIVNERGLACEVTARATTTFHRNEAVLDELRGVSAGTALAATLRPLGLVAAPRKKAPGRVELLIAEVREIEETWPVGWPLQQSPYKVAPDLFKKPPVEIKNTPLSKVLAAIQQRANVPFLLDHNSLARQNIDPGQVMVSYPRRPTRYSYRKIINSILFKAKLTSELRVDEAGKPFLWISTAKK